MLRPAAAVVATGTLAVCLSAQIRIDSSAFGALEARSIGPAVMSGRIAALAGNPKNPRVLYVGAAGGGVWKTTNGGVTFKPVFDRYNQSIGAIALDPKNPETVWAGTGEPWVRNSVSVGNGIYKSTDGGENWQHLGLPESERISKILIDPRDSNVVYVAVPGKLWSSGAERGLFKTTDGGKSWKKILFVDDATGCSDVDLDPQEPDILYAGMWQFRRTPWSFQSGGPGSGLYRSSDGGAKWTKLRDGIPEGELGRIAVAVAPSRPSTVYALIEAKKNALLRSDDAGRTWQSVNTSSSVGERPFYFSLLVVDPQDHRRIYKPGMLLHSSADGGKTLTTFGAGLSGISFHPDLHALWIDPQNTDHLYLGTDGGVYTSQDRGRTWRFLRNLPVSQFYHVSADMQNPFFVYGGLQDNGSWMGPSASAGGVLNKHWNEVGFGDGFYVWPHPSDPDVVYSQYQGGRLLRFHKRTQEIKAIPPQPRPGDPKLRFNWNAATAVSPSQPDVFYIGAQFLYRSRDRGESWERISPDLTTNDPQKLKQSESGGLTLDATSAENHCTIYAIAESPKDARVVWVGTDDGNVQLTRDGGKSWASVASNVSGLPKGTWVSGIEASRHAAGRAYATFDGHMTGDMKPYVYRTDDYGATWTALATPEIKGFAHVAREDLVQPDLLFLGTEFGLYVTLDGGRNWAQFTGKLPNVAVRDLAIHPREQSLVIATHGRGIYILDDLSPLRQITPEMIESAWTVVESRPSEIRLPKITQSFGGDDEFAGANPPEVAWVTYWLKERQVVGDFTLEILDGDGKTVTKLSPVGRRGLNRVAWPMRLRPPKVPSSGEVIAGAVSGPTAPEGVYTAKLVRDGDVRTVPVRIVAGASNPHSPADRKLQQTTLMQLYRMLETLAYANAALVETRAQARKLVGSDLAPAANEYSAALDKLNSQIAAQRAEGVQGITGEERLREQAGVLYGEILRYGGRPTTSQVERTAGLQKNVDALEKEFLRLTGPELDALNAKLRAGGQQPINRLTREAWEKRSGAASAQPPLLPTVLWSLGTAR